MPLGNTQTQEGQAVGFETEAYAIMDTLRYIRPDVHTVCCGKAFGNAAMLLASGKKGNRYALPHASIMTCPPRLNRKVDTATNLMITANELDANTETYVDYLTEFTGKTRDEVLKDIARTRYFTPETAIEYGLIDKVVNPKSVRAREGRGGVDFLATLLPLVSLSELCPQTSSGRAPFPPQSLMEKKDYERMLQAANARYGGGRPGAPAAAGARGGGRGGGD